MKINLVFVIVILTILSGCVGKTQYTVTTPDGLVLEVKNTKEYESYILNADKVGDDWSIELKEKGVYSSNPMKVLQDVNSELVTQLLGTKNQ